MKGPRRTTICPFDRHHVEHLREGQQRLHARLPRQAVGCDGRWNPGRRHVMMLVGPTSGFRNFRREGRTRQDLTEHPREIL